MLSFLPTVTRFLMWPEAGLPKISFIRKPEEISSSVVRLDFNDDGPREIGGLFFKIIGFIDETDYQHVVFPKKGSKTYTIPGTNFLEFGTKSLELMGESRNYPFINV